MAMRRTYGERCAAAHALDLVGERWALLVVRELLLGPKRFTDLRRGIPNAGPNVLAQRLRELESTGVVRRAELPPPAASHVYELTEWGLELGPVMEGLGRWGSRSPLMPRDLEIGRDSMVLALRTMFDPASAGDFTGSLELRLDGDVFAARVAAHDFEVVRGEASDPDAVLSTDPPTLSRLVWEGLELAEALESGDAELAGDRVGVERFLRLFPRPVSAEIPAA